MFRNPRENARVNAQPVAPSVGRPPTPPSTPRVKSSPQQQPSNVPVPIPSKSAKMKTASTPLGARTANASNRTPNSASSVGKGGKNQQPKGKPNQSILTFFKKADPSCVDVPSRPLFFAAARPDLYENDDDSSTKQDDEQDAVAEVQAFIARNSEAEKKQQAEERFHEHGTAIKKRKISGEGLLLSSAADFEKKSTSIAVEEQGVSMNGIAEAAAPTSSNTRPGPFLDDSDDSSDDDTGSSGLQAKEASTGPHPSNQLVLPNSNQVQSEEFSRPRLEREQTSPGVVDDFPTYEDIDEYDFDEYAGGEEAVERRFMEEQRRIEMAEAGIEDEDADDDDIVSPVTNSEPEAEAIPECPICSNSLSGLSDQQALLHVNSCLDGNPTALPKFKPVRKEVIKQESIEDDHPTLFKRPVRPAKPGQANPFTLGEAPVASSSAFSMMMSGHAEDAAWAAAADSEAQARGKPAYQRTCPFYKILPGFFICVDAFRYGAVKDCAAYFLSHFHSDHYIGLTSRWCHGPIFASKVTCNLMRESLRVEPKYLVPLEWEVKTEVPGTRGVFVTMITANHCPGSSLFLFEKVVGKGPNAKVQRVLHCGDFRACRAHLEHPMLRPEVMDAVSGKTRQQKIDVCYLDTTYLNPKYAFPSQEAVIRACADMCVSLNKVRTDESDGWEQMKRDRAGAGMVKFIQRDGDVVKQEDDSEDVNAMKVGTSSSGKDRGKLLVVVGTYSIGKERICLGIARALKSKIYAPPGKQRICKCLEDPELNALLTNDPREAQVHMTPLFEIRAETLDDYLKDFRDCFARAVGFRPTGWNYRPPNSRFVESPLVQTVLHSDNWKSGYSMKDLIPQRGSTRRASCFGVPYSEHSSFRELTMFCCALRIDKIIPTVNIHNARSRDKMKGWCEKWAAEKKKNGLYKPPDGEW